MAHFRDKPIISSVDGNELLWALDDPSGTPADVKISVDAIAGRALSLSAFPKAVQDIIGAMVAAAGGTYNAAAGTITLPSGGGGQASDATLTALAALTGAGVLTATATDTFAMRAIGAAAGTDILDRQTGDARYAAIGSAGGVSAPITKTASFTLALADAPGGVGLLIYNSASNGTCTLPTNASVAHPIGTVVALMWGSGAGIPTFVAASGVTLRNGPAAPSAQYQTRTATKIDTDEWVAE